MKVTMRIPTQQWGFIEVEGQEEDIKDMQRLHSEYAENKLSFKKGTFIELDTFTGERIRYNDEMHEYEDMDGNKLVSASQFAEFYGKPFNKAFVLPRTAKKLGVDPEIVDAMWNGGGNISRTFGTAIHATMEQWFKYKEYGTEYHKSKHPFLLNIVETFPKRDSNILTEVLVSCVSKKMVGRLDGLEITGEKKCNIYDWKSDANVKKNLDKHAVQLSFYAAVLAEFGWETEHIFVENYTNKWEEHEVTRQEIKL